jgi:ATP-dependent helicase/nuclease subunit A
MLLAEAGPVEPYLAHIQKLIQQFWNCPIGTWIRTQHAEEENEYPILIRDQHIIRKAILDRTFVENNRRWIIDFKTDTEAKDMQKYRIQVNRYAEYMQELHPGQNIFCGLYFLKHQTWKTWAYDLEELFLENCVQIME